jgi:hypothetical protein
MQVETAGRLALTLENLPPPPRNLGIAQRPQSLALSGREGGERLIAMNRICYFGLPRPVPSYDR